MSLPVQMSNSLGPPRLLLGSKYHFPGLLPCTVAEIGQIHTTMEISFIATDAQNK